MDRRWDEETKDLNLESEWLKTMLNECQDPKKADVVHKITVLWSECKIRHPSSNYVIIHHRVTYEIPKISYGRAYKTFSREAKKSKIFWRKQTTLAQTASCL